MSYNSTINAMADKILAVIPDNPGVLKMTSPWELLRVRGIDLSDLENITLFQVGHALRAAIQRYNEGERR